MNTDKTLLRVTIVFGLPPLIGGCTIFFWWWIGKAWFLENYHFLQTWGFVWMLASFPLGLIALITGFVYLARNSRTNLKTAILALVCVLTNLPVLNWILDKQVDIDQRAYVRIHNNTGVDLNSLTVKNSLHTHQFGPLKLNDNRIGFFYPNYDEGDSDGPEPELVELRVSLSGNSKTVVMPHVFKGECLNLYIDAKFNIKIKGRWYDK